MSKQERIFPLAGHRGISGEIAQTLFLTENTIEAHLRSVFRKLAIRSRAQLARAL